MQERQVLGYATLGAAIIADVALNTVATERMGDFAHLLIHPWGTGAFQAGSGFLLEPEIGRCIPPGPWVELLQPTDMYRMTKCVSLPLISTVKYTMRIPGLTCLRTREERWVTHLEAGNEVDCLDRVSHRLDRNSKQILYAWFFSLSAMDGELSMDEALVLNEGVEFFGDRDQVFSREALSEADIDIIKERVHTLNRLIVPGRDFDTSRDRAPRRVDDTQSAWP